MAKKQVLGRGLGELLSEVSQAYENNLMGSENDDRIVEIRMDQIRSNPYQPRKRFETSALHELADSIKEYGLLQPILVYKDQENYVLIAGERRYRASKLCGKNTIKAIVADLDLNRLREIALIENIQREDLNPIDLAYAYDELLKHYNLTHEELAERIQKSRAHITNTLRLLHLSDQVQKLLVDEKITQGHAKVLVGLEENMQEKFAHTIIGRKLSVREAEKMVQNLKKDQKPLQDISKPQTENQHKIETILKKNHVSFFFKNNGKTLSILLKTPEEIQHFLALIER